MRKLTDSFLIAIPLCAVMLLSGCSDFSPDSKSTSSEGLISDPYSLRPVTEDGIEFTFPEFVTTEVSGADGYELQISTSPDFGEDTIVYGGTGAFFETHIMRPEGAFVSDTVYYWRARAWADDAHGEWTESRAFVLSGCGIAPSESGNQVIFSDGPTIVSWTGPDWAAGYHLQISANPDFGGSLLLDTTEISSTIYEFAADFAETLPHGSEYFWRLRARNADGVWSAWSPVYGSFVPPRLTCGVSGITATRAVLTVSSISDGGLAVMEAGYAWGPAGAALDAWKKIPLSRNEDASVSLIISSTLTKLAVASAYSVRPYVVCSGVTVYGPETGFTTSAVYSVGDTGPAGGTVFLSSYFNKGLLYCEAAPSDLSVDVVWSPGFGSFNTSKEVGSGKTNTENIIRVYGEGSYAAKVCADLSLGGFDDWFLPSYKELQFMLVRRSVIGGFVPERLYWSSSDYDSSSAYIFYISSSASIARKSVKQYVRAIRYFSISL